MRIPTQAVDEDDGKELSIVVLSFDEDVFTHQDVAQGKHLAV